MLIILSGLPGVGKTSIARELARQLGATHVRIDSIEQAIRDAGLISGPMNDAGYRVGYAVALDNFRAGRAVIADSVNPLPITREAWVDVARCAQVKAIEIEIACSNVAEHRGRVDTRANDIVGSTTVTWEEVVSRDYRPWEHEHMVIDTSRISVEAAVTAIRETLRILPPDKNTIN
jgi:predicted kinase